MRYELYIFIEVKVIKILMLKTFILRGLSPELGYQAWFLQKCRDEHL